MDRWGPAAWRLPHALALALCLAACATPYDSDTDQAISALQRRIDRHLVALATYADPSRPAAAGRAGADRRQGTPPSPGWVASPSYTDSETHYGDVDSAFASLDARMRATAAAGSQDQVQALSAVQAIARLMAQEHRRLDVLPLAYLQVTRDEFLGAFSPLLSYQRILRPAR